MVDRGNLRNSVEFSFIHKATYVSAGRFMSAAAAAAKLLQSCPTLCDPIDSRPPGFPIPGILQARTLEWVAISAGVQPQWIQGIRSGDGIGEERLIYLLIED